MWSRGMERCFEGRRMRLQFVGYRCRSFRRERVDGAGGECQGGMVARSREREGESRSGQEYQELILCPCTRFTHNTRHAPGSRKTGTGS
jgi:hypothetical protein